MKSGGLKTRKEQGMSNADPIVSAGRRLAHLLLSKTSHCPDIEFVDVVTKAGCDNIATESGFVIRTDRLNNIPDEKLPEVLAARVFHSAAHMLCIQAGVSSHSGSGRHTQNFELALRELGCDDKGDMPPLTKSQQKAAEALAKAIRARKRTRSTSEKTAYERGTVACLAEGCKHTITLRLSAIKKTRFLCVEHAEEMALLD